MQSMLKTTPYEQVIMSEAPERRRYTRIQFDGDTTLIQGQQTWAVNLLDVSLKGALVEITNDCSINKEKPVTLLISLAGEIMIQMDTGLVHKHEDHLGLHCTSIDMESMSHLRRLIELNVEDPKASHRVLEELMHGV